MLAQVCHAGQPLVLCTCPWPPINDWLGVPSYGLCIEPHDKDLSQPDTDYDDDDAHAEYVNCYYDGCCGDGDEHGEV